MTEKRYAIVRVDDNWCPNAFDNISMEFICSNKTNTRSKKNCKNCRYGDTKEQLIRKVAQVIKRKSLKGAIWESDLAKEIVEFLGVEE